MISAETNYDIHDKELLIIVIIMQEWRVYLEEAKYKVKVLTDHKNLIWFTTTKVLNKR
jgi:RNase H-like domain found in reverse transcriptase